MIVGRGLRLALAAAIVAVLLAYGLSRQRLPVYQAQATIQFASGTSDMAGSAGQGSGLPTDQTYANLLTSWPVFEEAVRSLGLDPARDGAAFGLSVAVQPIRDTSLSRLVVSSYDRQLSSDVATILPAIYNRRQLDAERTRALAYLDNLQAQLSAVVADINQTQASLDLLQTTGDATSVTRSQALRSDLARQQAGYQTLVDTLEQARLQLALPGTRALVVTPPREGVVVSTLYNSWRLYPLAAGLGFLCGACFFLGLSALDDTMRSRRELTRSLGLPLLAAIPRTRHISRVTRDLVRRGTGQHAAVEAYRILGAGLRFSRAARGVHTLMVTSAGPGEGKSTTAANLALTLAQEGLRVILVDTDLRRPTQHRLFDLPNAAGCSLALLQKDVSPLAHLEAGPLENLRILTAGPIAPNPAELLASRRMRTLMDALAADADIVLYDSPPVLAASDAATLAALVDGVALVVDWGHTRRAEARQALERLDTVRGRLLGVVFNRMPLAQLKSSYYAYYASSTDGRPLPRARIFGAFFRS